MEQKEFIISGMGHIVGKNNVLENEPMKKHTSFKVGGPADIMVTPETYEEVKESLKFCIDNNIPYFVIGKGSNLLVKDAGIRGVVIKLCKLSKIEVEGNKIIAQSGATLRDVSDKAIENSLSGFEFASGIPGAIGGACAMNAGAYDGEMKNIIESVLLIDSDLNIRRFSNEEMNFGYRDSEVLKKGYTVLEVVFNLNLGNKEEIKARVDDLDKKREEKQPLEYPSAGSTFKRPTGHFTGKLIQECGLKGHCIGGAQVSEKHSGFIINRQDATANDILTLIGFVQKTIKAKFDVDLQTEIRIIGEDK